MRNMITMAAIATSALTAQARALIHAFDFDTLRNGHLAYTGINKGVRSTDLTFKNNGSSTLGRTAGALGSDSAFYSSNQSSVWLGNGSDSLGCGTTQGFTISFWCKPSASHTAWSDFFGFRVGGISYRFEYTTRNSTTFSLYSSTWNLQDPDTGEALNYSGAAANTWHHFALVATPNGTNSLGTCALFVNAKKVGDVALGAAGELQQINIGSYQREGNGNDRKTAANNTGIDEVAVFDYPAPVEQLKWLAKHKPAQPADGPGRAMPICWLLDTVSDSTGGVQPTNYGTGADEAYKWKNNYANYVNDGACGSAKAFHLNNDCTFRVDGRAANGLGATLGSGMTLSFWIKAPVVIANIWKDFMSFCVGTRYERFEWEKSNPAKFSIYGTINRVGGNPFTLTADTWHHICLTWNEAESRFDFYQDGEKVQLYVPITSYSPSEALKSLTVGAQVFDEQGHIREKSQGNKNTFIDEIALFNHSLSPAQIRWLTANIPSLPPLDATNLVRTVSASGAWAGGLASWTVREWDDTNETWANTMRTTIYPTLEDTEVDVAVSLADGVVITNDTFVTPKKLVLTADGTRPSAATLKTADGSRFAPEALEIGDGLQFTVPLYAVTVGGTLTLGTGSKITFDVSNFNDGGTTNALSVGSFALPAGESASDILAHFDVTDNRYTLSLSADERTVYVTADTIPATATWTGAGDGKSLGSAANWQCRNTFGAIIPDALPCERTRVIVCAGTAALNAPVGTTLPWRFLSLEADSVTLSAAETDWRGLPALTVPEGVTVDLGGNKLYLNETIAGRGTFTDAAVAGGELHFDIADGVTFTNEAIGFHATRTFALTGTLKLVKAGTGTFIAARTYQSYSGGTEVAAGTLKLGEELYRRTLGATTESLTVRSAGTLDINGYPAAHDYVFILDGGRLQNTRADISVNRSQLADIRLDDDSTFAPSASVGLIGSGYATSTIDLRGHTLTVPIALMKAFYLCNTEIRNGLIDVTHGGWVQTGRSNVSGNSNNPIIATNVDFRIASAVRLYATIKARDYTPLYNADYNAGTALFEINGTFKPARHNYFHGCKMMDGSTIDFSSRTNALPLISSFTDGAKTLTFETNKTVYIKFGEYRASNREPIISWTAKPADIDTVTFKVAPGEQLCRFVKKDDGLYIIRGFTILIR